MPKPNLCSALNLRGSPLRECGRSFALVLAALLFSSCATPRGDGMWIQTTAERVRAETLGVVLPHEHVFTDLRGPEAPGYGQADAEDVVRVMKPLLAQAKAQGVDLLVECTGIGVGRNAPLIARLAKESGLRIVVPTGVYGRANFAPKEYREMSEAALTTWMVKDITEGIDGTGVKAGFIKIASSEKELKPLEEKFLRTAARAAKATGVAIASHTTSGTVAVRQADILREEGLLLDRFIWVHAQAERDLGFHKQLAARGVYIELDSVGGSAEEDARLLNMVKELIAAGHRDRILLSHDAGWYNPGQVNGGTQRPYTALLATFVPALRAAGLDEATVRRLIVENPRRAFAVRERR
ncbi:MAG: TatD family hydrolase [Verrucomicrobia bacterium]|nr:TatD family hydrolase [Verrucomicrobiota bacterium]